MPKSGDERPDGGSNTEPRGETIIDFDEQHDTESEDMLSQRHGDIFDDGGPSNKTLLKQQEVHRSQAIWNAEISGGGDEFDVNAVLKIYRRRWKQKPVSNMAFFGYMQAAGFLDVWHISHVVIEPAMITALVERWRPETHTFHMPVGEMTITLQDIAVLYGLPIDGLPLTGQQTPRDWEELCMQCFGRNPKAIPGYVVDNDISLRWFEEFYDPADLVDDANDHTVCQYVRASIMRLIGCILFVETTESRVSSCWLPMLVDCESIGTYSWGSACLAHLYNQLCRATDRTCFSIAGDLALVSMWAAERIIPLRPVIKDPTVPKNGQALGIRWTRKINRCQSRKCMIVTLYRRQLDELRDEDVIWLPYPEVVIMSLPSVVHRDRRLWLVRVPLIAFCCVEWHYPDRVFRQFGYVQGIPHPPEPDDGTHSTHLGDRGQTDTKWDEIFSFYVNLWKKFRHNYVYTPGLPTEHGNVYCHDGYMNWYKLHTRRFISHAGAMVNQNADAVKHIPYLSQERQADWWESNAKERYAIYKAANKGDWETAKRIYNNNKLPFDAPITAGGHTALHIATLAGQTQFARKLIYKMRNDDGPWQQDSDGGTPVLYAMVSGDMALVEEMVQNRKGLAKLESEELLHHIHSSTYLGRKDLVTYMFGVCKDFIKIDDRADLLVALINADKYDTALDLANEGWFAACSKAYKVKALSALAEKPNLANTFPQAPSSGIDRCWNLVTSGKAQRNNLHRSADKLAEYICDQVASDYEAISNLGLVAWKPIFDAARLGNVEFLQILIERLPDAVCQTNNDGRTIFHVAVLFRRAEVFDLLSEISSFKYLIAQISDNEDNNLLHMAGMSPPSNYLDDVPGEALKLQRELLWFKRVEKFVGPVEAKAKNVYDHSPDDVFMISHKNLIEKAEEWMKKTADSCTIVAALVATVVFAAAFTVPGGNNQNTGFPMFLNESSFKTFIVSDAISLISALSSLLTFMSIQTSKYTLEDFVSSLPTKLLIGYSTLFVSITAMMVTFVTVLFVYFQQYQLLIVALPLALVTVIPIGFFARLHFRLLAGLIKFWLALKNIH